MVVTEISSTLWETQGRSYETYEWFVNVIDQQVRYLIREGLVGWMTVSEEYFDASQHGFIMAVRKRRERLMFYAKTIQSL